MIRNALAVLAFAGTFPCQAAAPQASVELLPQAKVAGGTVVLGEVARLKANDLDLMRKLVALPLGEAPRAGEVALLQRESLAQWVRRQAGLGAAVLEWKGAQESRVLRVSPRVKGEDIARAAVEAAQARMAAAGREPQVRVRLAPRDLDVPPGPVRLEVRGLEDGAWRRRPVLWVDVWVGSLFVRTIPVSLEVAVSEETWALPSAQEAPQVHGPDPSPPNDPENEPPVVARGDWATLRAVEGPIVLESRVEVLQDGRPGQKIRVRSPGAPGLAFARVIGRGRVELVP